MEKTPTAEITPEEQSAYDRIVESCRMGRHIGLPSRVHVIAEIRAAEEAARRERDAEWCRSLGFEPTYGNADLPEYISDQIRKDDEIIKREQLERDVTIVRNASPGCTCGWYADIEAALCKETK